MPYSIPYIILIIFFLFVFFVENTINLKQNSVSFLNFIVLFSFIVFFGFRGFVGWDWYLYFPFYKTLDPIYSLQISKYNFDVGFVVYSSIIKTITEDYHCFIFISILIDAFLLHLFFKRYLPKKYYAFGFALFLVFYGTILEINLMRNVKSLLLFLLSLKYIENRNLLKFILLNILGALFHWSSFVFFPLYFFLHKKFSLKFFIPIFLLGCFVFIANVQYIKPFISFIGSSFGGIIHVKINYYLHSPLFASRYGFTLGFFERMVTVSLIFYFYEKLIEINENNILFINAFFIYLLINLFFSEISIAIDRFGNTFIFAYWILWPMIMLCLNKGNRVVFVFCIFIILLLKINVVCGNLFYQYDNVLIGHSKTYNQRAAIFDKNNQSLMGVNTFLFNRPVKQEKKGRPYKKSIVHKK